MDDNLLKLKLSLEEKTPTLLLGAGFSYGAINKNGENLPLGQKLVENLYQYMFVDNPPSKDILDEEYSATNWSQGKMPLPVLERLLIPFLTSGNILGIDICGECQQGIPLPQYLEAEQINGETNKELFDFLMHYCRNF